MKQKITQKTQKGFTVKKAVLSLMMVLSAVLPTASAVSVASVSTAALLTPTTVNAQIPVTDIADSVFKAGQLVRETIAESLRNAAYVAYRTSLSAFLSRIAYDSAVFIASGGENQRPLVFTQPIGEYLVTSGDAAIGEYLNFIATESDLVEYGLCDLQPIDRYQFNLTLEYLVTDPAELRPYRNNCTLSDIRQSVSNYRDQAALLYQDPDSLVNFSLSFQPGNDALSSLFVAVDQINTEYARATREAEIERLTSDYLPKTEDISGSIETAASAVEELHRMALDQSNDDLTTITGSVVADATLVFTNTLTQKLIERYASGFLPATSSGSIASALANNISTSSGIQAAQERFASIAQVSYINDPQTIDMLSQFANCPNQGQSEVNCVISDGMRQAIEDGLTLQEALDQGLIRSTLPFAFTADGEEITSPQQGLSYRNVRILKQYSVVPVGWVLAAEYNRDFDNNEWTIGDMVDFFDNCDEENYSPYCGLVDPNWPLKLPQVSCRAEAYTNNVANVQYADDDGISYTPQVPFINRLESCVDPQSCLEEDENGNCLYYGYCSQQERVYRFEGESCPSYQASCVVYTQEGTGTQAAFLSNTTDINGCTAGTAGCDWRCSEEYYSDVDQDFRCVNQTEVYTECSSANGCACSAGDGTTCTVADGGFKCTTDSGSLCTLGTEAVSNASITFDNDVETCSSENGGCTNVTLIASGTNLVMNSSFEHFNDNHPDAELGLNETQIAEAQDSDSDTFGFYGDNGDGQDTSLAGEPCSAYDAANHNCYGWELANGVSVRATDDASRGDIAAVLEDDNSNTNNLPGTIITRFDTGQPLENRSFVLSYDYQADFACSASYWVKPDSGLPLRYVQDVTYSQDSAFQTVTSNLVTFDDGITDTVIAVGITAANGCNVTIDAVQLEENTGSSGYSDYASDTVTINLSEAQSCEIGEIGCTIYTPVTGESSEPIPGIITNPYSQACGEGGDFSSAECSQCEEQFVGCDAFIPQPSTELQVPIANIPAAYESIVPVAQKQAIAQRTGYYCSGTTNACNPDLAGACGGNPTECLPSVSIIPDTGESCQAQYVGCEEYVRLGNESGDAEELVYFSQLQQCVQETPDQVSNEELAVYYTWQGTDESGGIQLQSHYLKKSTLEAATGGFGPCVNLDIFGATAQTSAADCIDDDYAEAELECTFGDDPDCRRYYDQEGNFFDRLESATIPVGTEANPCEPHTNTLDGRRYHFVEDLSTSCPATANQCREYKGSQGSNVRVLIDEDFDNGPWTNGNSTGTGGEQSETIITENIGYSMALGGGTADSSTDAFSNIDIPLDTDSSYVATFWALGDANETVTPFFYSASDGVYTYFDPVTVTDSWNRYVAGPVEVPSVVGDQEFFGLQYSGTGATQIVYIDNVEVQVSSSYYLINNSADSCTDFEGCEQYRDQDGDTHYLKSFESLCDESKAGCEAVINTMNSTSPFFTAYNDDNVQTEDDLAVSTDVAQAYVITNDLFCNAEYAGCSLYGLPTIDENGDVESYTDQYLINNVDDYTTTLCEQGSLRCEEYTTASGEIAYFKDPGNKICTYNSVDGEWQKPDGSACPLQNEDVGASPSQPLGPVCNGGERSGLMCNVDSDCPSAADDDSEYLCQSDINTNSGWVGVCSPEYNECTTYIDPISPENDLVNNSGFEINVADNDDITAANPDNIPDDWRVLDDALRGDGTTENSSGTEFSFDRNLNYYYDALGAADNIGCDTFEEVEDPVFAGQKALVIGENTATTEFCMVGPDRRYAVSPNNYYTLSGKVYVDEAVEDSQFAIGLLYFNASLEEISAGDNPEDYAVAAYEGDDRAEEIIPTDQWLDFHVMLGPNREVRMPADTAYVQVFVETTARGEMYFDDVKLVENNTYNYIASTVDGDPLSDTNTCNGTIDVDGGCVAFQDIYAADNTMNYFASVDEMTEVESGFSSTTCLDDDVEDSEACRSAYNRNNANRVISVRNDRQCSEWLACRDTVVGENGEVTCIGIGSCVARASNGVCIEWVDYGTDETSLTASDAISAVSEPGNVDLTAIENRTGYSNAGLEWASRCVNNVCQGGASDGNTCTDDSQCSESYEAYGYYPYDVAPQRGVTGVSGTTDLVSNGDFEAVYCGGDDYYTGTELSGEVTLDEADGDEIMDRVLAARDTAQSCTVDTHCRTADAELRLKEYLAEVGDSVNSADIPYSVGFCANVESINSALISYQWNNWSALLQTEMNVIDYESETQYLTVGGDVIGGGYAASSVDFNNVLFVDPDDEGSETGIYTSLAASATSGVVNGNEYVLSFDAEYLESPRADEDFIKVGIAHGSPTSGQVDEFEDGTTFQLSTDMKTYTFGPITIENKEDQTDQSYLYIYQVSGGSGTPFVIDNVSLMPQLEVNAEGNENSPNSAYLLARECRAYPTEDAPQCNFTDDNGVQYTGWRGYCLEHDQQNTDLCVAWWPVDNIAGEPDSNTSRTLVEYTGKYPAYHCLAAKGNESPSYCYGDSSTDGLACSNDAQCGAGICYGNGDVYNFSYTYHINSSETLDIEYSSNNYRLTSTIDNLSVEDGPHSDANADDDQNEEGAVFIKLDELPIESRVHISEIRNIEFDLGDPVYANSIADPAWNLSITDTNGVESGNGFNLIQNLEGSNKDIPFYQGGALYERSAFLTTDNFEDDSDKTAYMVFHNGWWCDSDDDEDGLCDEDSTIEDMENSNLIFTKATTSATESASIYRNSENRMWQGDENNIVPYNPFNDSSTNLTANSSLWNGNSHAGFIEAGNIVDGIAFENPMFLSRYIDDVDANYDYANQYDFDGDGQVDDNDGCWRLRNNLPCGANVMGANFEFTNGYLSAVYLFYWDGLMRFDVDNMANVSWTFDLLEPCLLLVESVTDSAQITPWTDRVATSSTYQVPGAELLHGITGANSLFGSLGGRGSQEPDQIDGRDATVESGSGGYTLSNVTALSENDLPQVMMTTGESTVLPFSYISGSSGAACVSDYDTTDLGDSCPAGFVGYTGVCSDGSGFCSNDSQCSTGTCDEHSISYDGVNINTNSYEEQLAFAARQAWERYRLVFADTATTNVYYAAPSSNNIWGHDHELTQDTSGGPSWLENVFNADTDDYRDYEDLDSLALCTTDSQRTDGDVDDRYCAIAPNVSDIRLEGATNGEVFAQNGEAITLQFDSDVDESQQPLVSIRIAWEASSQERDFSEEDFVPFTWEAASRANHTFTHAAECDPVRAVAEGYWNDDLQACEYAVKVQISDNWGFCSGGTQQGTIREVNGLNCSSYDAYAGTLYVTP